jgi:hypothetical protein
MTVFANDADKALYTALSGATALTSLLAGGTASPSVFHGVAPQGSTAPYVVFNSQSGSVPVKTFTANAYENALYQVKGITSSRSARAAGTIQQQIDTAIDGPALSFGGHTHMGCERVQEVDYVENGPGGQQYYHRGAIYRLRAY